MSVQNRSRHYIPFNRHIAHIAACVFFALFIYALVTR